MCAALLANQRPATVIAESTGEALDVAVVATATTPATPWPGLKALAWVRARALSNILAIPILSRSIYGNAWVLHTSNNLCQS